MVLYATIGYISQLHNWNTTLKQHNNERERERERLLEMREILGIFLDQEREVVVWD